MALKDIKELRSKDIFTLCAYSMLGLSIPIFLFILLAQVIGVPFTFNDMPYYGIEGMLYSLLFFPLFLLMGIVVLWIYLAAGWKLTRIVLPILGLWKETS